MDRSNLLGMVGGGQYRSMATIDHICLALEPLGDTLGVVVNLQDVTATTSEGADTLSRNCQLGMGERAMFQQMRQVGVLDCVTHKSAATIKRLSSWTRSTSGFCAGCTARPISL